jgi:cytochrome c553
MNIIEDFRAIVSRSSGFGAALVCAGLTFPAQAQPSPVQHGDYLVNRAILCGDCHSPHGAEGTDRELTGAPFPGPKDDPGFATYAPSLRGLPAGYTQEAVAVLLQTGIRPNGSKPRRPMPGFRLDAADAHAVAAYLASLSKPKP